MVKWNGLLPLGSIVLLNGSDKRMQIVGQLQADAVSHEVYDYAAVPFPEGYIDENESMLSATWMTASGKRLRI